MSDHVSNQTRRKRERRERAHKRVRTRVRGTAERPRLSVYKSLKFIYAQVIDDDRGVTLAQANSAEEGLRPTLDGSGANRSAAKVVGETVAARALEQGIQKVVFDRGGYIYHGNVKTVAEAAREKGLQF
jgi:large subunit ribosomal protein L18